MSSYTCFLIDDDPDDREIFALALEEADKEYKCATASNGIDAIKQLNEDDSFIPHLIFLDLNMPIMNGKQCLNEIRKIRRISSVPIIIYTTSSYAQDMEETKKLGASHFLIKPSSIRILTNCLTELLKKENPPFLIQGSICVLTILLFIFSHFFIGVFCYHY